MLLLHNVNLVFHLIYQTVKGFYMNKKALILDDVKVSQLTISMYLRKAGFSVDVAQNGMEGLKHLDGNDYNIIFSDVEMPNMNGFEFLKRVKRNDKHKNTPVIMLTAVEDENTLKRLSLLGATFNITKPCNYSNMSQALSLSGF